jgi:hypothetical protein
VPAALVMLGALYLIVVGVGYSLSPVDCINAETRDKQVVFSHNQKLRAAAGLLTHCIAGTAGLPPALRLAPTHRHKQQINQAGRPGVSASSPKQRTTKNAKST